MEAYTLNEVPLAGYAILQGRGQAAHALDASAVPSLRLHGRPSAASMGVTTSGAGVLAVTGRGEASMSMSAAARAYLMICAVGDAAVMVLSSLGAGRVIPVARGVADMAIQGAAKGVLALLGRGESTLELGASARGTNASRGAGLLELVMSGAAGIPYPIKLPDLFTRAHPSRWVAVDAGQGAFTPAAQERNAAVPFENRTIIVAPERNE